MKEKGSHTYEEEQFQNEPSGTPGTGAVSNMHRSGEQRHDVTGVWAGHEAAGSEQHFSLSSTCPIRCTTVIQEGVATHLPNYFREVIKTTPLKIFVKTV